MTELPLLKKRQPSGTKVTLADVVDCPLVKIWTANSITVGWLVDVNSEFVDVISTVSRSGHGRRHRIDRKDVTNVRVTAEPDCGHT